MEKTYKATQKFLVTSPRKLRLVANMVKKISPKDAVTKLEFVHKRAAENLGKVIKAAIAAAVSQGISDTDLVFSEIQIGEGPRLKRGIAASRGRWHPIKKRMSHIRVVLTARKSQTKEESPKSNVQSKDAEHTEAEVIKEENKIVKAKIVKTKKGNKK